MVNNKDKKLINGASLFSVNLSEQLSADTAGDSKILISRREMSLNDVKQSMTERTYFQIE